MTEKEMYLSVNEREFKTTVRVLQALPADKLDFKPHERSRTAGHLAWGFTSEDQIIAMALDGNIDFTQLHQNQPATLAEVIAGYEASHAQTVARVQAASEEDLNKMVSFAGQSMRVIDVLWFIQMDAIHHRGQFSVYLRLAGGKVPSIYGPSADEPWDAPTEA
jgi:uncharacterized damage-inducible protein DinB